MAMRVGWAKAWKTSALKRRRESDTNSVYSNNRIYATDRLDLLTRSASGIASRRRRVSRKPTSRPRPPRRRLRRAAVGFKPGSFRRAGFFFADGAPSGLSQSNRYYMGDVFFVCPLLLSHFPYPSNNVSI